MSGVNQAGLRRTLRRAAAPATRLVRTVRQRYELRKSLETIHRAHEVRVVLIYHRIAPRDAPRYEVVPTVPCHIFREHLTAFSELGTIVPLETLLADQNGGCEPLRFALTFDDDYATHTRYAAPILREFGLHGTFFLSGRALHGLGGYWFERLEALVTDRGFCAAARLLDVTDVSEPAQLPLRCEGDTRRRELIERHAPPCAPPLTAEDICDLVTTGMSIGFHTLHHPVLPALSDGALCEALTEGRDRLERLIGRPLRWFAYPHGKTDGRTLRLMRAAGYTAAWTTQPRLLRPGHDYYQYGRWDPLPLPVDDVLIRLGRFLRRMNC